MINLKKANDYIFKKFLTYENIRQWCEKYTRDNQFRKAEIYLYDNKNGKSVSTNDVACMLYNAGIPAYRNTYNLRSFRRNSLEEIAVFYLTVKGFSIVVTCKFYKTDEPYRPTVGDYLEEPDGQLRFKL